MISSRLLCRVVSGLLLCAALLLTTSQACADRFTYVDQQGETVTVEARLAGSGQGMHALELADGRIQLVPQRSVKQREVAPGPEPISNKAMIEQLTLKFGKDRFRAYARKSYVIGLVLSEPLPKSHEGRAGGLLKQAARFMRNVEVVFMKFAGHVRFPTAPPTHPMVLLIFESDEDFNKYAIEATGQKGLSAQNIAGFYSGLTNWLAVRLTEFTDFEVPLHEAIHQQVYNRHVLQRLAPVPAWFNEGIATAFEGTGERINDGLTKLNPRYALNVANATKIDWATVVSDDKAFRGDVLAGEAYTHAWSLHWLLVSKYKVAYSNYVKMLSQKQTLASSAAEERTADFERAFGKGVGELQSEFRDALRVASKRQRMKLKKKPPAGYSVTQANLGAVELKAVRWLDLGGALFVEGRLKKISPIPDLAFHVTVETAAGTYAEWHLPKLAMRKTAALKLQRVAKWMKNAPGGSPQTFIVRVRSVPSQSAEAKRWNRGQLPVPVFRLRK